MLQGPAHLGHAAVPAADAAARRRSTSRSSIVGIVVLARADDRADRACCCTTPASITIDGVVESPHPALLPLISILGIVLLTVTLHLCTGHRLSAWPAGEDRCSSARHARRTSPPSPEPAPRAAAPRRCCALLVAGCGHAEHRRRHARCPDPPAGSLLRARARRVPARAPAGRDRCRDRLVGARASRSASVARDRAATACDWSSRAAVDDAPLLIVIGVASLLPGDIGAQRSGQRDAGARRRRRVLFHAGRRQVRARRGPPGTCRRSRRSIPAVGARLLHATGARARRGDGARCWSRASTSPRSSITRRTDP